MPVRVATPEDLEEIVAMMHEHAAFEGAESLCHFNRDGAAEAMFGDDAVLHALVATPPNDPNVTAGVALWYRTFSSWAGCTGIWLEDLFVRPAFRGDGLGRQFLEELRGLTTGRVEWDVQNSNENAQAFYRRLGANPVPGWTRFRWTL
jgi:GNAT superfamily N-acetyltransferase